MPVSKPKVRTKRIEVARLLEDAILTGRLTPGTRLRELKLAAEFGVSQASIREALQHLESLGLVVKYPNRGSFVINLEADDVVHIYQVRRVLEPLACALAATHLSQATLDLLEKCIQGMEAAADCRDYRAYLNADREFHRLIWESQPNPWLGRALKGLCLPLFANDLILRYSTAYIDYERAEREHRRIVSVLRTRDADLVRKVVDRMMRRFLREDLADYARLRQISEEIEPTLKSGGESEPQGGNG
jgi:DNA-binding GntR family transcriptional regulator